MKFKKKIKTRWHQKRLKDNFFSEAKKLKMEKITVEGADLIFEIGKKIKENFDEKKLPLMIGMIDAILNDKKLEIKWKYFS